jgi:hypothetical protein
LAQEPYHDERLPVREDRPELNFSEKRTAINTDEEWHAVRRGSRDCWRAWGL